MPFSPDNLPDLVIFDNDGVLIDSEIIAAKSTAQALAEFGYSYSVDEVMHAFIGMSFADMRAEMARRGIKVGADFNRRATELFLALKDTELTAISGAKALVADIKEANIPVCVCSNATLEWLGGTHEALGLDEVFNPLHYFHRDSVKAPKPAPDMHLLALDSFGVCAERTLVIEDTSIGTRAARAAGIAVWGFLGASGVPESRSQDLMEHGASKTFGSFREIRYDLLG